MKWLRKKIINWLFGTNFVEYERLYNSYVETTNNYINCLDRQAEVLDSSRDLIELNQRIIKLNNVLIDTLKENGIDVDKIDLH